MIYFLDVILMLWINYVTELLDLRFSLMFKLTLIIGIFSGGEFFSRGAKLNIMSYELQIRFRVQVRYDTRYNNMIISEKLGYKYGD